MSGDEGRDHVIRLGDEVIDLVDEREPTVVEVARSAAVRRAAARALQELELHHHCAPWIVICPATSELIAASPSFDPGGPDWTSRRDVGLRLELADSPLAVLGLGASPDLSEDDPAVGAAHLVLRALSEIVVAEQRAEAADQRAGRAEALAATDALTGVGNQRAWWDRIAEEDARLDRSKARDVIAVVDLDDLKVVNDQRGHLHGDLLLRLTAVTLRKAIRPYDVLARVGGDEFAVLAVDFDGEPSVLRDRIASALVEVGVEASVGVASPSAGVSLIDAYDRADQAMYAQKHHRRPRASAET